MIALRPLVVALLTLAAPLALAVPLVPLNAQALALPADSDIKAQQPKQDSLYRKYFVGSTLFMLANLVPDNNPPQMVYLNVGYRMTGKDIVSLEFKTWKYGWPIGIPYGKSFEAEGEGFPGSIREYGVSLNYQRFLRKRLFAQVDVMPAWQSFLNEDGNKIDNAPVATSNSPICGRVKLPQLTCAGRAEATWPWTASQYGPPLL